MDRYYDNTRLTAFKRCPRYYYFRHLRDFVQEGSSAVPLVFGGAWHEAMDSIWKTVASDKGQSLTDSTIVETAFDAFMAKWLEEGLPPLEDLVGIMGMKVKDMSSEDKDFAMRNPMTAKEMLYEYLEARSYLPWILYLFSVSFQVVNLSPIFLAT